MESRGSENVHIWITTSLFHSQNVVSFDPVHFGLHSNLSNFFFFLLKGLLARFDWILVDENETNMDLNAILYTKT